MCGSFTPQNKAVSSVGWLSWLLLAGGCLDHWPLKLSVGGFLGSQNNNRN